MIVPQYWAEGRLQLRRRDRQITVRRFGWSDISQEEAQRVADERTHEAFERVLAGEKLDRREPRIPYNGAVGFPIREEVVSRHGETVITRNSYGARVLNTPNVLFADVDFTSRSAAGFWWLLLILAIPVAFATTWATHSANVGGMTLGVLLIAAGPVAQRLRDRAAEEQTAEQIARERVSRFVAEHPSWSLRIYRTPAGLRVLATHRPFEPNDPEVKEFFDAIGTDRLYALMCANQQCFRARVSPKPWRIGIHDHLRPRPGVWPIAPERLPERNAWIANYEARAASYAACRFLQSAGTGVIHPEIRPVQELHDALCQATGSDRKIA